MLISMRSQLKLASIGKNRPANQFLHLLHLKGIERKIAYAKKNIPFRLNVNSCNLRVGWNKINKNRIFRESDGGYIHHVKIQYYLADDTIEVKEEGGDFMLARTQLPKMINQTLQEPGSSDPVILLNVLSTGYLRGKIAKDSRNVGAMNVAYYRLVQIWRRGYLDKN